MPTLVSITMDAPTHTAPLGGSVAIGATLNYDDGSHTTVTTQGTWTTSQPSVVAIPDSSRSPFNAVGAGSCTVTVTVTGIIGSTTVTVQQPLGLPAPATLQDPVGGGNLGFRGADYRDPPEPLILPP